ncbi:MAG: PD40 domain-containing protein [Rhodanobacteraceae bacterium]|nr:PD40 domain-containing protein [Rhodanobacteraceae bacterium]HPF72523.1 PDZ domain-containing protein [Xanthomonadaceae bacterium]HRX98696.1 PDZ domain-containing protein [Xanthomonadaceae bacterium]
MKNATRLISLLALAAGAAASQPASAADATRLLRFPDVCGEQVAFVYAGDLYRASINGGVAQRLTSLDGRELYPKFSADCRQIAFSADFSGTRQVYVMPAAGGEPTQLTWYTDVGPMPPRGGTDYRVLDWFPDGKSVLVRANRRGTSEREGRPYRVPVDGGMEAPLKVPMTGGGMLSPDGNTFVYTPIDRDFRSWKRYRGGRAQDVWTYDLVNDTAKRLTDNRATDHQPMWVGDRVYFVSDRNGQKLNLYGISPDGGAATQLTNFDDFDILWPSAGASAIVFEKGGRIWRFDPASAEAKEIPITVQSDRPEARPRMVQAGGFVESMGISPGGERALFGARGELFTAPAKHGAPRNISHTPEAREIGASWSPDGRWIAYLSDASGEYEVYIRPHDGSGAPRRLTTDGDIWRFDPQWSPDSKKLAFADHRHRLNLLDIASGARSVVDESHAEDITDYTWSPDSRFIAYVKSNTSRNSSVWLYALPDGNRSQLTADAYSDGSPAFDPEGRYLYFISNRDYNLVFSSYEFNFLYNRASRIYAATLRADGKPLYPEQSDDVTPGKSDDGKADGSKDDKATSVAPLRIDAAGFEQRVVAMKASTGDYRGLRANGKGVFVLAGQDGGPGALQFLALDADEPKAVSKNIASYVLSADGKKLLLRRGSDFSIVDAGADADFDKGKLDLSDMRLRVDPHVEWQQMYVDGWRILRDWFYDEGHHGQDWDAIRAQYQPLVDDVASRADLDYVFSELAGELNSGHVYVQTGDEAAPERQPGGLLGAEIVADPSGYFRVEHVFPGNNWENGFRSPLTEPGSAVAEGSYVLAVDGVDTRTVKNFYQLLEAKGDQQVALRINSRPTEAGASTVRVKTITSETNLRYLDWVQQRRAMVDELSGGKIGYIHVPNTAVEGSRELFRGMVAYAAKDALIIDDRFNGGGFIPDRLIELLSRQPLSYWKSRGLDPNATPLLSHVGPKAMLINGLSSSGGDALPYYFRKMKLGPLIGTRTWGGLIGISGNPGLSDGGSILASTFRFMDTDGNWAVENEGVAPDVEVIDAPDAIAAGRDPSLEKAVDMLLKALQATPPKPVRAPAAPTAFPPQ